MGPRTLVGAVLAVALLAASPATAPAVEQESFTGTVLLQSNMSMP